ncbi:MAG: hypothetical protein NWE93_00805 [Candidatus Bathyarchaeota archaeon]|nr:hypothetical protein [Candidatus Bathyarchaeota archaeon]
MENAQKFVVFIKIGSKGADGIYQAIMKWNQSPLKGVMLQEACQAFGKWDFMVLFEADTNENALHFVGDIVRPVEGVVATRTIPVPALKKWS